MIGTNLQACSLVPFVVKSLVIALNFFNIWLFFLFFKIKKSLVGNLKKMEIERHQTVINQVAVALHHQAQSLHHLLPLPPRKTKWSHSLPLRSQITLCGGSVGRWSLILWKWRLSLNKVCRYFVFLCIHVMIYETNHVSCMKWGMMLAVVKAITIDALTWKICWIYHLAIKSWVCLFESWLT